MSANDQEPTVVEPAEAELVAPVEESVEPVEPTLVEPIEDAEVIEDVTPTEPVLISSQLAPKLTLDDTEPGAAAVVELDASVGVRVPKIDTANDARRAIEACKQMDAAMA